MRRPSKTFECPVKTIWTLWYTKCDKCGYEYKWEKMYSGKSPMGRTITLCDRCCCCREVATDFIRTWSDGTMSDRIKKKVEKSWDKAMENTKS